MRRNPNLKTYALLLLALLAFSQCKKTEIKDDSPKLSSKNLSSSFAAPGPGGGVLMQAFYWNTPTGATSWWSTINGKIAAWDAAGIISYLAASMYQRPKRRPEHGI